MYEADALAGRLSQAEILDRVTFWNVEVNEYKYPEEV
jgi:hypothetical protein